MRKNIINKMLQILIQAYNPNKVILFGSYAWGKPTINSDIDIIVVVESSKDKISKRAIKAYELLREFKIPKDIIVYTEIEFNSLANHQSSLCYKVINEGQVLYDRAS